MKWTTPKELRDQVRRLWERGQVLRSLFSKDPLLPKRLVLKHPSSEDLAHAFLEVRDWCNALSKMSHIRFMFREVNHRVTGTNTYPCEAWLDSAESAVRLLEKQTEWKQFNHIAKITRQRQPKLLPLIAERSLEALHASNHWEQYLDIVDWLVANPRPGCYLRQVDLPGIHTKFIESNRNLLSKLFELALPAEAIDTTSTGQKGFCRRYGFREKPERIRFRVLDEKLDPLGKEHETDITLTTDTFADLQQTPKNIFITENETNFLAFPKVADSWIVFGAGYGFSILQQASWISTCNIVYWGDIDTHGFAILDELRSTFPDTQSLLMNRATLLAHQSFWDMEPKPCTRSLSRLKKEEAKLYRDLQANRYGPKLRLEQERVPLSSVVENLSTLGFDIL